VHGNGIYFKIKDFKKMDWKESKNKNKLASRNFRLVGYDLLTILVAKSEIRIVN
jgi:hypothetical protein